MKLKAVKPREKKTQQLASTTTEVWKQTENPER